MRNLFFIIFLLAGFVHAEYIQLASGAPTWKAAVSSVGALPASGNTTGDARVVGGNEIYVWNGSAWIINTAAAASIIPGATLVGTGYENDVLYVDSSGFVEANPNFAYDGSFVYIGSPVGLLPGVMQISAMPGATSIPGFPQPFNWFNGDGSGYVSGNQINWDSNGNLYVGQTGNFQGSIETPSLNYSLGTTAYSYNTSTMQFINSDVALTADMNNQQLWSEMYGEVIFDWGAGLFYSSGTVSLDIINGILESGGNPQITWAPNLIFHTSINDTTDIESIDPVNRQIYNAFGTLVQVYSGSQPTFPQGIGGINVANNEVVATNSSGALVGLAQGSAGQVLTSNGTSSPTFQTAVGAVNASANLTSQTGAVASIATFTPSSAGSYRVGGYLTVNSIATDVLNFEVTYTDETSTARTVIFTPMGTTSVSIGTTGPFTFPDIIIRSKTSTAITIKTVLTTGLGSVSYDVGGYIQAVF